MKTRKGGAGRKRESDGSDLTNSRGVRRGAGRDEKSAGLPRAEDWFGCQAEEVDEARGAYTDPPLCRFAAEFTKSRLLALSVRSEKVERSKRVIWLFENDEESCPLSGKRLVGGGGLPVSDLLGRGPSIPYCPAPALLLTARPLSRPELPRPPTPLRTAETTLPSAPNCPDPRPAPNSLAFHPAQYCPAPHPSRTPRSPDTPRTARPPTPPRTSWPPTHPPRTIRPRHAPAPVVFGTRGPDAPDRSDARCAAAATAAVTGEASAPGLPLVQTPSVVAPPGVPRVGATEKAEGARRLPLDEVASLAIPRAPRTPAPAGAFLPSPHPPAAPLAPTQNQVTAATFDTPPPARDRPDSPSGGAGA